MEKIPSENIEFKTKFGKFLKKHEIADYKLLIEKLKHVIKNYDENLFTIIK